ncbi:hypothetical protein BGZ59_009151 [Podila verticillata]|nr:hypothetical protein BGZ59_009151 [Podila verticillata]
MADTFPLPIECLQLVITNLAIKRELKALASLLRVSKHVCLATLPILYEDPFVWFGYHSQGQQHLYTTRTHNCAIPLIQLLFASAPRDSYSGLVKAMYGIGNGTELPEVIVNTVKDPSVANNDSSLLPLASQHWHIDYLSYVRHFNAQDQNGQSILAYFAPHIALKPQLKSYVEKHKLAKTYAAVALNVTEGWPILEDDKESPTTLSYLKLNIHREATWALCSPILEQLQSIVIPLSDIGRYLDSIARLSSLSTAIFKLDEYCDVKETVMGEEEINKLHGLKEKHKQDLESAIKFVQMHTGMFHTLQQVLCPTDNSSWYSSQSCAEEYLDRMLECLPSLIYPSEVNNRNWKQFVLKAEQTNLELLKKIDVWDQESVKCYQQIKTKPFLHRCKSLREYNMISLGPDSFKWATQKTNIHDHEYDKGTQPTTRLPPLEVVSIRAIGEPFGSELQDIGLSFGATIKSFTVQWYHDPDGQTQTQIQSQSLLIGRGWKMPFLSTLEIAFPSDRLVLDPDFLRHCPSLRRLSLNDFLQVYDLNEIKPSQPAYLPELMTLLLSGSGALSFHPDTLHSTKELKILSLGTMNESGRMLLPSFRDMYQDNHHQNTATETSTADISIRRPKWTWDWYLPLLHSLQLTYEFACHFKFQMLQGTPNLQELCLSLYSTGYQVERMLTKDDFTISRLQDQVDTGDGDNINKLTNSREGNHPTALCPTAPKDPSSRFDLHSESKGTLAQIHWYLFSLNEYRKREPRPPQVRIVQQEPLTEQQLQDLRVPILFWDRYHDRPDEGPNHMDGACPEEVALAVRALEELADQAGLQSELEAIVAELQVWRAREREEEEGLKNYRVEHPEQLVVPSVKKLEIFGHWIMSDEVLEMMLGHVFRNVREWEECMTEGYSLETLIRVTQSMLWLASVHSFNRVNLASLSDEYMLQPERRVFTRRPPYMNDARTRVCYQFADRHSYHRGAGNGFQATGEVSV